MCFRQSFFCDSQSKRVLSHSLHTLMFLQRCKEGRSQL